METTYWLCDGDRQIATGDRSAMIAAMDERRGEGYDDLHIVERDEDGRERRID